MSTDDIAGKIRLADKLENKNFVYIRYIPAHKATSNERLMPISKTTLFFLTNPPPTRQKTGAIIVIIPVIANI